MNLFIAMVALSRAELPAVALLQSSFRDHSISNVESSDHEVSFTLDDIEINCGLVRVPIPQDEIHPILQTSPYWLKDDAILLSHQAHWIVAASGDVQNKKLALILTKAIAGLLKSTGNSIAVYWGAGNVVTQKDIFVILQMAPPSSSCRSIFGSTFAAIRSAAAVRSLPRG